MIFSLKANVAVSLLQRHLTEMRNARQSPTTTIVLSPPLLDVIGKNSPSCHIITVVQNALFMLSLIFQFQKRLPFLL